VTVSSIPGQGISPEQFTHEKFTTEQFTSEQFTSEQFTGEQFTGEQLTSGLHQAVDVDEATRQLELAAHDVAVASSCIGLGDLDSAHTSVITARAAVDAAENILRVALNLSKATEL
jgi:hypothetical protein